MKKINKLFLFCLGLTVLAIALVAALFFVPYKSYEYIRSSDTPEVVHALYIDIQGDPLCTKIYLVGKNGEPIAGIFPRTAKDLPDPNRTTHLKDGDELLLEGFRYDWRMKNKITGTVVTKPIHQMDLTAWSDNHGNRYSSEARDIDEFSGDNYTDCHP